MSWRMDAGRQARKWSVEEAQAGAQQFGYLAAGGRRIGWVRSDRRVSANGTGSGRLTARASAPDASCE